MAASGSFRAVFWVAVLPALLAVALLWVAVDEPAADAGPKPAPKPARLPVRSGGAAAARRDLLAGRRGRGAVFARAFLGSVSACCASRDFGLPVALAPLTLVTMNVVYAFAAYPAGVLSDRFDRLTVVTIGFFVLIAADLALALAGGLVGAALGVALWGLHLGLTQGVLAALVADAAPPDQRGAAFGVFNLVGGVATLIGEPGRRRVVGCARAARGLLRRRARLRVGAGRAGARRARRAEPCRSADGGAETRRPAL